MIKTIINHLFRRFLKFDIPETYQFRGHLDSPREGKYSPNFACSLESGFEIQFTTSEDPTKSYTFEAYDDGRKMASREFKLSEFDDKAAIHIGANNINNI